MKAIVEKTVCVLGDYELKFPLDCDSDVMGKEFKIRLDKVTGRILFPHLAPSFIEALKSGKLDSQNHTIPGPVCPINGLSWGNDQDNFGCTQWGQTMSFPKGNSLVKRIMLSFSPTEPDMAEDMQTVYNLIDTWFERFYDIYEITSMMPIKRKEEKIPPLIQGYGFRNTGLILYAIDSNTKKPITLHNSNDNGAHIKVELLSGNLNYDHISQIVDLTNEQKEITFGYKYFLEGFRAFTDGDYKKAVTICSPALEATLLTGIENFAASKNIYFLDKLLNKYRMLGGYFALAKDIDMELPTQDYKTTLLDLRNNVIHKGYSPTREETEKYLKDVRLYLDTFSNGILELG